MAQSAVINSFYGHPVVLVEVIIFDEHFWSQPFPNPPLPGWVCEEGVQDATPEGVPFSTNSLVLFPNGNINTTHHQQYLNLYSSLPPLPLQKLSIKNKKREVRAVLFKLHALPLTISIHIFF